MGVFRRFARRHSLVIGVALMFLVTWTIDLSNSGVLPFRVPFAVALTVGWGFALVALAMTYLTLGSGAVVRLLRRYLLWRVGWSWWLVALLLAPGLRYAALVLTTWRTGEPADFSAAMIRDIVPLDAPLPALVLPWLLFELLTNGEEIGWRGYVLPRLQAKTSALIASLIVGLIWSAWHLPKFWGTGLNRNQSLCWFIAFTLAAAVLYTWLYNNSRGSLLLVSAFHASQNTAGMFLPVEFAVRGGLERNILVVLYIVAAIVVVLFAGAAHLARTTSKQIEGETHRGPFIPEQPADDVGIGASGTGADRRAVWARARRNAPKSNTG